MGQSVDRVQNEKTRTKNWETYRKIQVEIYQRKGKKIKTAG